MSNDNLSDPSPTKPLSSEEENRILWDPRKPNWDEWENVTQSKLWVAIALAQNIEPKHFDYFRTGKLDTKFTKHPPQFTREALNNSLFEYGSTRSW
ncbi:MAG: hypothetical protein ACOH1Q_11980, partial [Thiobacillus sp.]